MPEEWIIEELRFQISESVSIKQRLLESDALTRIAECALVISSAIQNGKKLLIAGNGGSAADAQHIAAEFVVRFETDRPAIPAIALNSNTSSITAAGNDFGYNEIFACQISAFGNPGDIFIGISTSGNSGNIITAFESAKSKGLITVLFSGGSGGKCANMADHAIIVPSMRTSRIQEAHITIGHIICSIVDRCFENGDNQKKSNNP